MRKWFLRICFVVFLFVSSIFLIGVNVIHSLFGIELFEKLSSNQLIILFHKKMPTPTFRCNSKEKYNNTCDAVDVKNCPPPISSHISHISNTKKVATSAQTKVSHVL